jgi:hypothetical protein
LCLQPRYATVCKSFSMEMNSHECNKKKKKIGP